MIDFQFYFLSYLWNIFEQVYLLCSRHYATCWKPKNKRIQFGIKEGEVFCPWMFTDHDPTLFLNMGIISVLGRIMLFCYTKRHSLYYATVYTINTKEIPIILSKKIVILSSLTQENHLLRDLGIDKCVLQLFLTRNSLEEERKKN